MNNTYYFTDVILHSVLKRSPRFSETYSDLLHDCAHLLRRYQSRNVSQTQKCYLLSMHSLNVGHVFQVKWRDMVELEYCNSLTSCIDIKYKRRGMTLLHGHAFRIIGSLWGELTVTSEFPVKKAQRHINVMSTLTNCLSNTHDTGEQFDSLAFIWRHCADTSIEPDQWFVGGKKLIQLPNLEKSIPAAFCGKNLHASKSNVWQFLEMSNIVSVYGYISQSVGVWFLQT